MSRSYKARGVVLHTVKYGESSLVAYLFTDVGGRQTYMIQGVRSSRGRGNKAALFQPMFLLEFEGIEQPHAQMHRMKDAHNLVPLTSLPFDCLLYTSVWRIILKIIVFAKLCRWR